MGKRPRGAEGGADHRNAMMGKKCIADASLLCFDMNAKLRVSMCILIFGMRVRRPKDAYRHVRVFDSLELQSKMQIRQTVSIA